MVVEIEGVPLHLAHPDELPVSWVGQEEVMRQLLAAWLVIDPKDIPMNPRLLGKPGYLHDFPGLALESVHWLADCGILMFGVEAIGPAPEGEPNYLAHMACAERGITHMECLANLDRLVGRGRFRFIGFPLRIRGGTASPIRAVAMFE